MSDVLARALFQSTTRTDLLEQLFVRGLTASVSELARRARLSPRSVANEVRHLAALRLVTVEVVGGADVVKANLKHPAAKALQTLLRTPRDPGPDEALAREVRESLAAWGAPLAGVAACRHFPLGESLLRGLEAARQDGTVLRVLPAVLAEHLGDIDWSELKEDARHRKLKAELGMLVELTAGLLDRKDLCARVADLKDRRRRTLCYFPAVKSEFEKQLARKRSPAAARNWGFGMNLSEASFRSTLERHRA
jgi:hypothetical protein